MASRPTWYESDFPEYRSGPPWVMEDMIAAQVGLASSLPSQEDDASAIVKLILGAGEAGTPIVVSGCGTAGHAAQAIAMLASEALVQRGLGEGRVQFRYAFEVALAPWPGVMVAVSHGGRTRAMVAAINAARKRGAATALTADAAGPAAADVDQILVTPIVDRSWCHTVGYLAPIVVGGLIAAQLRDDDLDTAALEALLSRSLAASDVYDDLAHARSGEWSAQSSSEATSTLLRPANSRSSSTRVSG